MWRLNQLSKFSRIFDWISRIFDWLASNWNVSHLIDLDVAFYNAKDKLNANMFTGWRPERENCQKKKPSSVCLYNNKNITRWLEDMNFMLSCQEQYLTREHVQSRTRSLANTNWLISSRNRVTENFWRPNVLYTIMFTERRPRTSKTTDYEHKSIYRMTARNSEDKTAWNVLSTILFMA